MNSAVIVSGARTAIGSFGGALSDVPATELGRVAIESALNRAGIDPDDVEEVIMGNVLQAGVGMNPARQSALASQIPESVPSFTVNKVCGSGLKAVSLAAQAIIAGDADLIVAGGMESMSRAPYLLRKARTGYRLGNDEIVDSMLSEGLTCAMGNCHMGVTAENIAAASEITREMQDEFAAESQRRAQIAIASGLFDEEIASVLIAKKKGETTEFNVDEYPRAGTDVDTLGRLRPAFQKDGTVTAGNASGINDGAAALVVASEERARLMELTPMAKIVSYASAGVDPRLMGMGPVPAIERALEKAGLEIKDIDLFELNEAFAAQSLAVLRKLSLDDSRVNVNGGAIALGHPIGASGARVLVTLLYEMKRRDVKRGLASLCIGGGQGIAMNRSYQSILLMSEMENSNIGIEPGAPVVVNLHSPREKLWGVLRELNVAGVFVRGIDLNTFDDWVQMIVRGERNMGLTHVFLPMWRVERVALDETVDEIPSLAAQFYSRVGLTVNEYLDAD